MKNPGSFVQSFGRSHVELERQWAALLLIGGMFACTGSTNRDEVVVFAAASLTEAVTALAKDPSLTESNIRIRTNFAGSQQLASQIDHGADANVFLSADERWVDFLVERGLASSKQEFATSRLVVVAGKPISRLEELDRPSVSIIVGADAVPIGHYTRQVLSNMTADPRYGAAYTDRIAMNIVSQEENVRAILAKVMLREATAGFVYQSDVQQIDDSRYNVIDIPDEVNVQAAYFVTRIRDSRATNLFVRLLLSRNGQRVLSANGFSSP